ncbi:hypothetical protein FOZ63_020573 [Perkinsus olseni]|uniref:Uncharacterized protein n=1 Tax=Perkinsus olseni TaxID=32597 RepID=A0A7J6QNE3_PEROL|nr:hypothetical protein FOZ63_020573 [Perkinsus olseni]KAF4717629.1 hypothetical protein FOZ62_026387 [Perkinsus olseni]
MIALLFSATVLSVCSAQADPLDRLYPFYGTMPNPGSYVYVYPGSGLQLTYNITRDGNMTYGIECSHKAFEDGPFEFPSVSKFPPNFINFYIDITGYLSSINPPPGLDRLYDGSKAACPFLKFIQGDLGHFMVNSPDSGTIQFQGERVELTRDALPLREGSYRTSFFGSFECFRAFFLLDVTQEGSLELSCSNGRTGDGTAFLGPYRLLREEPGEPYQIDFGGSRDSFLDMANQTCGICFNIRGTDLKTLDFSDDGVYTDIDNERRYLQRST